MDPYKVLIKVMRAESLTRATERLYISQPSMSRDIRRLELKYHVEVFEFKSPYLKLTGDDRKLLQYALKRESIEQRLRQNLASESEIISDTLTIGSSYTYGEYLLSEQLTSLMQQYPKLYIHLHVNNPNSVINGIKHSRVDIGIIEKGIQDNAIECKKIMENEMVYIYKKSLRPRMDVCFVRKKGSRTRFYQEVGLSESKLNPYLIEINNIKIIKQMVGTGNRFAIISKSAPHPEDYEKLMMTTLDMKRHYYLVQHVDKYTDKSIRAVIEVIMKQSI